VGCCRLSFVFFVVSRWRFLPCPLLFSLLSVPSLVPLSLRAVALGLSVRPLARFRVRFCLLRFCRLPLLLGSLRCGLVVWVSSLRCGVLVRSGLFLSLVGGLSLVGFLSCPVFVSSASLVPARSFLLLVLLSLVFCVALLPLLVRLVVLGALTRSSVLFSLRFRFSRLLPSVVVVGLSPPVRLLSFGRWLLLVGFGCRFRLRLVPLVWFPLVCRRGVLLAFLPGLGRRLRLLVVWACLAWSSCRRGLLSFRPLGCCSALSLWAGVFGSLAVEFSSWGFAPFFLTIARVRSFFIIDRLLYAPVRKRYLSIL
jgi:hypothetical protein